MQFLTRIQHHLGHAAVAVVAAAAVVAAVVVGVAVVAVVVGVILTITKLQLHCDD